MSRLVDNSLSPLQEKKDSPSETTTPKLKLVVSNPIPVQESLSPSQPISSNLGFTAAVQNKGPHLYEMKVQDLSHYLRCDLTLETEESRNETELETVICHFPDISDEELNDFVWEDETLLGITLIQFQMKILEQLLLFCAAHNAKNLIIRLDEVQNKKLEIYREIVAYEDNIPAKEGKFIEMTIPTNPKTFDNWVAFMNKVNIEFRQTLWQDQCKNPAIRQYLKSHSLG